MVVLIYWLTTVILPVIACTHQIRFVLFEINNNFNFFLFFPKRTLLLQHTASVCILFKCTQAYLGKHTGLVQKEQETGWEVEGVI